MNTVHFSILMKQRASAENQTLLDSQLINYV